MARQPNRLHRWLSPNSLPLCRSAVDQNVAMPVVAVVVTVAVAVANAETIEIIEATVVNAVIVVSSSLAMSRPSANLAVNHKPEASKPSVLHVASHKRSVHREASSHLVANSQHAVNNKPVVNSHSANHVRNSAHHVSHNHKHPNRTALRWRAVMYRPSVRLTSVRAMNSAVASVLTWSR